MNDKQPRYIFYLPSYGFASHSTGVKILWYAASVFAENRVVKIKCIDGDCSLILPENLLRLFDQDYDICQEDIVIYPDIVTGNPLGAKKIVRYLMARPQILTGLPPDYKNSDFLLAYSNAVSSDLPSMFLAEPDLLDDIPLVNIKRKNKVVIYYGKLRVAADFRYLRKFISKFDEVEIITRSYPAQKNRLYEIISESSLLISLDPLSSIIWEANLLGTPAIVADDIFMNELSHFNHDFPAIFFSIDEYEAAKSSLSCVSIQQDAREVHRQKLINNNNVVMLAQNNIETHFEGGRPFGAKKYLREFDSFWRSKWLQSPILAGTTPKSVLAIHLMKRNVIFFCFCALVAALIKKIRSAPSQLKSWVLKQINQKVVKRILPESFIVAVRYQRLRSRLQDAPYTPSPIKINGKPLLFTLLAKQLWKI